MPALLTIMGIRAIAVRGILVVSTTRTSSVIPVSITFLSKVIIAPGKCRLNSVFSLPLKSGS